MIEVSLIDPLSPASMQRRRKRKGYSWYGLLIFPLGRIYACVALIMKFVAFAGNCLKIP